MKFIFIKNDFNKNAEFILNLDFVYYIKKEKKFEVKGRFNYVEIPNEFNYFIMLKNGDKFRISFEEYEKIKKVAL